MTSTLLLGLLALATAESAAAPPAPAPFVVESYDYVPQVQDGTLIACRGDCLAVKIFSHSAYTHVGLVLVRDGAAVVYDAMPGPGVQCVPLVDYMRGLRPTEVHLFQPTAPLTAAQIAALDKHLASELGRPYAVKHHLTGRRVSGIHCAEYLTDAYMAADLLHADCPPRVSPASLIAGLTDGKLYTFAGTIRLKVPPVAPPADDWCTRTWHNTKQCSYGCYRQLSRWFCCK